jgi:hypothetical protein
MDAVEPSRPAAGATPSAVVAVAACVALAAGSLGLPSAPGYDAWSWLQWGREVASLQLATEGGPAFKPLPVTVAAALAPAGSAAPELWLLITRAAALLGALVAGRLAWHLAGGSATAAVAGALGVLLCSGWATGVGGGGVEGPLILLALLACERALAGRPGAALGLGSAAALLRPEAWPFLGLYAVLAWRHHVSLRRWIAAGAVAIPACWLLPEALAAGDPWRSAARATVPNPGAPALSAYPALESLRRATMLPLAPLALAGLAAGVLGLAGALGARRAVAGDARRAAIGVLGLAGLAWVALVAAMSELGFSGEERYALPGAAVLSVAGAAGLGALGRRHRGAAALAVAAALAPFALARAGDVALELRRSADAARLAGDLEAAVAAAGGRSRVLACGRPYVGPYRGSLLAWQLDVAKRQVRFAPRPPAVVFRSRLVAGAAITPRLPPGGYEPLARTERWEVVAACWPPRPLAVR